MLPFVSSRLLSHGRHPRCSTIASVTPLQFVAGLFPRPSEGREELLAGPIRGELLGADHLAERARVVAAGRRVAGSRGRGKTPLLTRLNETRRILEDAHARLTRSAAREVDVGPAGDWLLDNFHVVQEHIREVRASLPRGYYRELPELAAGPLAGYPHVYELAITLISHTEGRIDLDNVSGFIAAFQEVTPLSAGELWAVPAMLRLGLIENVRRMALRTVQRLDEVEAADAWAARILDASEQDEAELRRTLNEFITAPPPLTPIFVSRLLHELRLRRGAFPPIISLERWIADEGMNPEAAVAQATQRLALTQIMMANSITSLRAIARMEWRVFVERQSRMEAVLHEDPSEFYPRMTFATRDAYRHVVERIAKRTGHPEELVARRAVDLARAGAVDSTGDQRRSHVGYYLVDRGLAALEREMGYVPPLSEALHRWVLNHPNTVFVGGIVAGTAAAVAGFLWLAGPVAATALAALLLFALLPANDIAINAMNQLVTAFLPPRTLPKLNFHDRGVPSEYRTAVVMPTLFPSVESVHEAIDNLEVQFLANRETHLHFAVLSDFTDSPTETRENDAEILEAAVDAVRALNARYGAGREDTFYLLHRARRWNPQQGVWMGWERKRGKLAEFNRFLRGKAEGAFATVVGDVSALRDIRYVITLDADTVLPPDAAPSLVGALAHPLNLPCYDPARGRVVRGYGILQPRVGVSLPSAHRSHFAAIYSGHPGVDPYTTAVSDLYQDLYGEGSFTGKGIYDVDAFEQATLGRFPENSLLSHDLIEGSYARAGLATDITLYDDYPTRYFTYTRRKHRWIRGDWQLLPWLAGRVPGPDGPEPNRLSLLSRWKLLDNLRRSTVEIAQLAFIVAGWTVLPGSPLRWTVLGLGAIAAPWLVSLLLAAIRPPLDKSWRAYYAAVFQDALVSAPQFGLAVAFLPHQAWVSADAILRTAWRMLVTRRHLLDWQTASQTERVIAGDTRVVWRTMWPAVAVVIAIALGIAVFVASREASPGLWQLLAAVVPLTLLWSASPAIAHALSAPSVHHERRFPAKLRPSAMRYALLHWKYFERFVGADTNWLAPDNFQDDPSPVVAMRTSPTNIGLQLLSTVSAYDLGFISLDQMTRRLELALQSMERMRRFRGQFFNWYDLKDLRVLEPAYISTVDSGNLAGHLVALRQACLAVRPNSPFDGRTWRALATSFNLAHERLRAAEAGAPPASASALATAHDRLDAARVVLRLQWASRRGGPASGSDEPAPDVARSLAALIVPLAEAREALSMAQLPPETLASTVEWIEWSATLVEEHRKRLTAAAGNEVGPELASRLEVIADRAYAYAMEMDFRFLYDESRKLFAIGYRLGAHALDPSYYDLLASEARLASFIAIAKNDVPVDHWFRLGRTLTHAAGETALVSWSGSMFEYLMPALVMQSFPFTVLDQTYRAAVRRQIAYGAQSTVPWGVSESAYHLRDRHLTYQYRAFGVPDLALKRGLGQELVVAPYASALALMVDPQRALENLLLLEAKGALGPYGFRDALDYTRAEKGLSYAVVRNYMAHHVGMSFIALTNALLAQVWQRRFHADPLVRSAELLLHERVPRRFVLQEAQSSDREGAPRAAEVDRPAVREVDTPDSPQPHVALLGYFPYTIMVNHSGGGYSRYEELAVTRWRSDGTRDDTGHFCYLKDVDSKLIWSAGHQPVGVPSDWYHAQLATDRVTLHRADGELETRTEIVVVPEDVAEVRRITVTNNGDEIREIELTSYGEVVLAPPEADRAHPAFGNLFVETEWHEWCTAITATRRPRSPGERSLWCVHVVDEGRERVGAVTCETDRARFLGRGRSTREPVAVERDGPLSGTTGAVLDPIVALRTRVLLPPGQSASVAFTTLVATTAERAFELAGRYHDSHAAQRALDLAWTSTQIELRELGITPADAAVFQEVAGHLFYSSEAMRAPRAELVRNRGSRDRLWAHGISGDWPILLAIIESTDGLPTLRQLFAAHRYWRRRGMTVDLVIVNAHPFSYQQELNSRITAAMFASGDAGMLDQPGGIFIRRKDELPADDLLMLRATARVLIPCDGRSLGRIIRDLNRAETYDPEERDSGVIPPRIAERSTVPFASVVQRFRDRAASVLAPLIAPTAPPTLRYESRPVKRVDGMTGAPLLFDNGFGGLTSDGDYQIHVQGDRLPPAPWSNVIANPRGGFVVSERGGGFTWAENSYFFRLTPWHNDPVSDPASEVLYLRDEESGALWCATPAPIRHEGPYVVRHRAGASSFEHEHHGIATQLTLGMAEDEPVKLSILRVTNRDSRTRQISVTAYAEWTLGVLREHTQHQVQTEFNSGLGAIFAQNTFDPLFARWKAFLAMTEPVTSHTGDRREFLGRNGTSAAPAALASDPRAPLARTTGAGIDPCAALQCVLQLAPGETREIVVLLGAGMDDAEAFRIIDTHRKVPEAGGVIDRVVEAWTRRLSVITVHTPDPAFDAMVNRWTLYQALACRLWARSALYQSSGGYGFRDQLQDVTALVYAEPALARAHILRAAARQFVEGDVQHWWHPQSGRGVRTRISDDLVWLPYVVDQYVQSTGDASVLDEYVPFLTMRELHPDEHEAYELPQITDEHGNVYEHCLRALRKALTTGAHGLPLIGVGDWNDGMNRVGVEGRGESVWLGWFLVTTLRAFAPYAQTRGDEAVAEELRAKAEAYAAAVEKHGWDGAWYRRAYFDDGTPLGSASSDECRIDSIAQSWSVISGAGKPARQARAMASLEEHLVREDSRLLALLTPPFDKTPTDPGYIKGYLPGVRENGAQYTHAALWAVLATALRRDGDRAFELYQMINPLTHALSAEAADVYKVEPYVVAADVYTATGQVGRGGWTWYTGSASWMYRVGLEAILGFTKRGETLVIDPAVPAAWPEYRIEYRYGGSLYAIVVEQPGLIRGGPVEVMMDGRILPNKSIPLTDDGERHAVVVRPTQKK